jgi:phosphinothricin acetyltransferase
MRIRETHEGDFDAIAELTNRYIVGCAVHFAFEPVTPDELRAGWLDTRDTYPWLCVDVDDAFAGYAKAGPWRTRAAYQWTPEVGIYVDPRAHGRGVGTALYGALLDDLRRRGFHSAIGGITLPNEASVRLHESLGFTRVATFRHAGHKLGAWHDVGFWQIMLQGDHHQPTPIG